MSGGASNGQGDGTGLPYDFNGPGGTLDLGLPPIFSTTINTIGVEEQDSVTRTLYLQYAPNSTFVTVQSVPIALSLSSAAPAFSSLQGSTVAGFASVMMAQSVVSAYCQPNAIMGPDDTRPYQFPDTYVAGCGSEDACTEPYNAAGVQNYTAISRQDIWNQSKLEPGGRVIWIENMTAGGSAQGTALGAIVVQPEQCETSNPYLMTSACMVGAAWANVTSFAEFPGEDILLATNHIADDWFTVLPQWSQPSIRFSKPWAESLSPMTDMQNRSVVDNLLRLMPVTSSICPLNGTYADPLISESGLNSRPFMHEQLLASLVANGMSHAAGASTQWQINQDPSDASERWIMQGNDEGYLGNQDQRYSANPPGVILTFQGRVPGYGWNLDGIPIKIALPILLLYCVYALSYSLYTLFTGRSSNTWRSISDLTALAMNSTPTSALKNTSCGVGLTDTYRKLVSVREVEKHKRLEFVFKQDEDNAGSYKRVVVGRGY